MKVTEQIDAIEASGVNPYRLVAVTRILACILMLPLLTLAADFSGLIMDRCLHFDALHQLVACVRRDGNVDEPVTC